MELQNYNQDIISTSSSDIPPNCPNTNNPSFPQNKYPEAQFQTQQQYNPPPSEKQYYQTQNIGCSSYPQNQTTMPILPGNQYTPQNYLQPITPVFRPPLGVDLYISKVKHDRITQPYKNVFKIWRNITLLCQIFKFIIAALLISMAILIVFILTNKNKIVLIIIIIIASIIYIIAIIYTFFDLNYKVDIILGHNILTVVKNAMCCRKKVTNYQKNDLSSIEFTYKETYHKTGKGGVTIYTYKLFFIFKNGQRERIFIDKDQERIFYEEEMEFLVNFINNYINNQIRF